MIDLEPVYAGPYPSWQSDLNYFTLNVGGGMIVGSPTGRLALTTAFRAHRNLATTHGTGVEKMIVHASAVGIMCNP